MDREPFGENFLFHGQTFEGIDDVGDLNSLGAPDCTGVAGSTDPDGSAGEDGFDIFAAVKSYDFPGSDIHGVTHRAGACAGPALDAFVDAFSSRDVIHLLDEGIFQTFFFFTEKVGKFNFPFFHFFSNLSMRLTKSSGLIGLSM